MLLEILILLVAVLLNGFFAAAELAIVSAKKTRLKQRAEAGDRGAATALLLAEDSGRFLSSVQIGITLIAVFTGAYGAATLSAPLADWLAQEGWLTDEAADDVAFASVIALITYVSLIFGELVPKRLALAYAEPFAAHVAGFMRYFALIGAPFVSLLQVSSNAVLRLLPSPDGSAQHVTEEEVRALISEGTETGVFAAAEKQMLEGVLRLGDRSVRAIMTTRQDVEWLDLTAPEDEQLAQLANMGNARLPVARGSLDEIVGVIHAKDVLKAALSGTKPQPALLAREPLIVHDGTNVLRLVDLFRTTRQHLAIVVDEHGSVEGVVTTTDILQAVTGTLPETEAEAAQSIVERADGTLLIDAMMAIDEVEARLTLKQMKAEGDDFHTLAGFVLKMLGHLPKVGERFLWQGHTFEVIDMDGRRIDKVLVTRPTPKAPDQLNS